MIQTDLNDEYYAIRENEFLEYKETLPKVSSDPNAKKEYYVGCYNADDWQYVHEILMKDGTLEDNIPNYTCECVNDCRHSDTRGIYLLTDFEAEELRNHPKVEYVNINTARYPGTYSDNPDRISASPSKTYRYSSTVKHKRYLYSGTSITPTTPESDLLNRGSYQLKRHQQQSDPWNGNDYETVFEDRIQQYGDGSNVDLIVCDQDMWFGHIEFQNNLGTGPTNYTGGNVLPGSGSCDLLDLVLDAPYYIDPDFFNADSQNRLMTRWDGTTVPVESFARDWWGQNSTTYRSSKFVSVANGGTASGNNDFGTITISSLYTRDTCNGSNTSYKNGTGFHGTPCASQAYGRQYGWAYNANKWFLNLYGTNGVLWEVGFDLQKVFHQTKPDNSTYGTKDPTISSNSWNLRYYTGNTGYYYFRQGLSGGVGVAYTDSNTKPQFMKNYYGGSFGDFTREYLPGHSILTAGKELIDSGVIFVCAAGNFNQKLVQSNHPDYNNYHATGENADNVSFANAYTTSPYSSFSASWYNSHNRPGFPQQIGIDTSTTPYTYKTIAVGALDNYSEYTSGLQKEARVSYSNVGNAVDVFASADDTLSACDNRTGTRYNRYDAYYTINGSQSVESEDRIFNGTSSACPIFAGILATKLQYNRSWTYSDVKDWIVGLGTMDSSKFYYGVEATTANDTNWTDQHNLQGNSGIVVWDKPTGNEPESSLDVIKFASGNGLLFKGVVIKYT
jgi:hypothetical protein